MSGIIIDKDDLSSIIGALVCVADSGIGALQENPNARDAQRVGGLCDLIARLCNQLGDPNGPRYEHNARECARLVAAFELAKIGGHEVDANIQVQ